MASDYTVRIKNYDAADSRLGRHVRHDSRSLSYLYPTSSVPLVSARHLSSIPTLDQGNVGSCTGNAATKCIATSEFWAGAKSFLSSDATADEKFAVGVYSAATKLDSYKGTYPPTDSGSDGLSVAKVLTARRLIPGYQHATSLAALLNALTRQAVIVGTEWRTDMYDPAANGRMKITGNVEGGHEYVLDEIDVENQLVWMQNSWGDSWGVQGGRAYFTWSDMAALLKADGDCTIFTPPNQPAPVPVPVDPKALFVAAANTWVGLRHTSVPNMLFEHQVSDYLTTLDQS